ncbi:MAG: Cysteine desulfurase SufS [Pseudomonadota bacterium]|jgi:cysteine desulfurase/selenocysteine lyase
MRDVSAAFPILKQSLYEGKRLAYLDSAATTQKPQVVIDALQQYYLTQNANIHRGVHYLSQVATQAFEATREKVRRLLNAKAVEECVFVKGTTDAINLVASSFGELAIGPGDEILISALEHHSNIVPWQLLCQRKSAILRVIPMKKEGNLDLSNIETLLGPKTKLLALAHVSNALGTRLPVEQLIAMARAKNIPVLLDGAQAIAHLPVDVQALDCDFYVFSSHKMYGPTGVGVLYAKRTWLEKMPPYQGGGEMISTVTFEKTVYNDIPHKFEAGTPPIGEVIGLGAAIDFLQALDINRVHDTEQQLLRYAMAQLQAMPGITLVGDALPKVGAISFIMQGIHPHDIGTILDRQGVAIRTGHHCAMPIMDFYGISGTARVSLGVYNTQQDIDQCMHALADVKKFFKGQSV